MIPGNRTAFRLSTPLVVHAFFGGALGLVLGLPLGAQTPETTRSASRPPASAAAKAAPSTPIVAVVNRQQITRAELGRECLRRVGEDVLESEVNKRLILEACQQHDVQVTTEEVEAEVERMANKFGVSVDRWLAMLQEERGISASQYRKDVVWPMLCLRKLAADALEVTEAEIDEAYESEYGEMVQVRLIATKTRQRAERLHAAAMKQPRTFDRLAKDYSEDESSAAARGLIPPIRRHVGDPTIEATVYSLKPGEISPIVEAEGQFYFFRCERRLPPRQLADDQLGEVRGQLADAIAEKKLREVGNEIFRDLQEQARIVNVFNDAKRSREMPGIAAIVNDQPVRLSELGEQCILRHGPDVLHGEINRKILTQALQRRSLEVTQADLQAEIRRAAEAYGHVSKDGDPDVKSWLNHVVQETQVTVDTYVRDVVWPSAALKKLVRSTVEVTDEDLTKGFEANYGPRVEVLAIVLSNQRTAQQVFEMARDNPTAKFFGELANQYS
ncbi:MAG TPA: peptidylprolyl isomerase, partial [Pirellulaceae bacterium]